MGHFHRYLIWEAQLLKEFDTINWTYKLKLERPILNVVPFESYFGQWDCLNRQIKISAKLIEHYPWSLVVEVLKHEIAHQYVSEIFQREASHGPDFQTACGILGVDPRFRRSESEIRIEDCDFSQFDKWTDQSESAEEIKLLQRVEKLLSLAQSSNEHEALAAMEKVNVLHEKFNLDRIQTRLKKDYVYWLINLGRKKIETTHSVICSILRSFYFVEAILCNTYIAPKNQVVKAIELIGTRENVILADYVFQFLVRQIDDLWRDYARKNQLTVKFKRSYQVGLLKGFQEKLAASSYRRQADYLGAEQKKDLVLLKEDRQLKVYLAERHPRLSTHTSGRGRIFSDTFQQGKNDGRSIVVNKGVSGSTKKDKLFLGY
jgi:hypothetical protein